LLWNAIYVRQADGSVAWYGHLKNGSQTRKAVGATVRAGEQLGVVGSSGFSTGPHLHLELHGAEGDLLDPFAGPCNGLNEASLWRKQSPYFVPSINRIATQSAAPELPDCPATYDVSHYQTSFARGDAIVFAIYLRDEQPDQVTDLTVIQPGGAVWQSWQHVGPRYFPASYWYWESEVPGAARRGVWRFRVRTAGQTVEQRFTVRYPELQPSAAIRSRRLAMSPASRTKVSTRRGSKCVPESATMRCSASSCVYAGL
jgi:hypothetical protein